MLPLLLKLVFDKVESSPMPFFAKPIAKAIAQKVKKTYIYPQIASHLAFLEGSIGKTTWFAGKDFSAADIQVSFVLEAAAARGGLDDKYPHLDNFLKRIHARSAYKRAIERGGEYELIK